MSKDTSNAVATIDPGAIMESVIAKGDLKNLSPQERAMYYKQTCDSMGLNPLTKPFQYITLNNQLQLYATRTAADQLRKINGVTLVSLDRRYEPETEMYEVSARMRDKDGREDEDISAVFVGNLKGDALGNARKKAVTQAKRRCTLSLCGLGWLDETEIDQIPDARRVPVSSYVPDDEPTVDIAEAEYADTETGEITDEDAGHMVDGKAIVLLAGAGLSPVDELLARTYAAKTLDALEAIRQEKNENGINDEELADAWRTRFKELGGKAPRVVKQPALVGATAGEPGNDRHSN
jgi:hypothetical protein